MFPFRTAESLCEQSVSVSWTAVGGDQSRGHSGPVRAQTAGHPKSHRWVLSILSCVGHRKQFLMRITVELC